eukprot:scaffold3239_cov67-Phaeocystis_antarctica.AAC.1
MRVDTHAMTCAHAHANPKSRPHLSRAGRLALGTLAVHTVRSRSPYVYQPYPYRVAALVHTHVSMCCTYGERVNKGRHTRYQRHPYRVVRAPTGGGPRGAASDAARVLGTRARLPRGDPPPDPNPNPNPNPNPSPSPSPNPNP